MPLHERLIGSALFGLDIELLTLEIENWRAVSVFAKNSKARATRIAKAASRRGIRKFREYWVPRRLSVSLPVRLYVEAVLFSMGSPWSDLVSGFKPLRVPLGPWK